MSSISVIRSKDFRKHKGISNNVTKKHTKVINILRDMTHLGMISNTLTASMKANPSTQNQGLYNCTDLAQSSVTVVTKALTVSIVARIRQVLPAKYK